MTIEPENEAERLLLEKAQSGERADISELPDPTVRAALLYDLCVRPDDYGVDPKGIQLKGARVTGQLDLEGALWSIPLGYGNATLRRPSFCVKPAPARWVFKEAPCRASWQMG